MKRNYIKLIKEIKDGEAQYNTFVTPAFISFSKLYSALDVMSSIESDTEVSEKESFDMMIDMVVDIYDGQFNRDELINGLHAPDALTELQTQIEWVAQGQMDEQRKKELAKMV